MSPSRFSSLAPLPSLICKVGRMLKLPHKTKVRSAYGLMYSAGLWQRLSILTWWCLTYYYRSTRASDQCIQKNPLALKGMVLRKNLQEWKMFPIKWKASGVLTNSVSYAWLDNPCKNLAIFFPQCIMNILNSWKGWKNLCGQTPTPSPSRFCS